MKVKLPPILAFRPIGHIRCWDPGRGKYYRSRSRVDGDVHYSRRKFRTAEGAEVYGLRLVQRLREKK